MSTSISSALRVPGRSNGVLLLFVRSAILTLDFATIIALAVSIGLFHKWIPSTSYPTTALQPSPHTDWTDLIVLAAVLISFMWTIFIILRPSWTRETLHPGYYLSFEFVCLAWLLCCSIPAFKFRESTFKNLSAISNTCDMGDFTLMNGDKVPWVCVPHLHTLKRLQIATYSIACAVAVIHFTLLSSLAYHSLLQRPQPDPTENTTQSIEKTHIADHELPAIYEIQSSSTSSKRSVSTLSSPPPPPPRVEVAEY